MQVRHEAVGGSRVPNQDEPPEKDALGAKSLSICDGVPHGEVDHRASSERSLATSPTTSPAKEARARRSANLASPPDEEAMSS